MHPRSADERVFSALHLHHLAQHRAQRRKRRVKTSVDVVTPPMIVLRHSSCPATCPAASSSCSMSCPAKHSSAAFTDTPTAARTLHAHGRFHTLCDVGIERDLATLRVQPATVGTVAHHLQRAVVKSGLQLCALVKPRDLPAQSLCREHRRLRHLLPLRHLLQPELVSFFQHPSRGCVRESANSTTVVIMLVRSSALSPPSTMRLVPRPMLA
mmetsp:Transcript_28107/g.69214  ORF Transcript_28107/g.69214 Transcript_28107/m.69214 type:complete len:212 (-) Transcript_28107:103-738(-)